MKEAIFKIAALFLTFSILICIVLLLSLTFHYGKDYFSINFFTGFPSRFAEKSGIAPALVGTLWLFLLTFIISSILGICSAIYVEELAKPSKFKNYLIYSFEAINGVPSIIFGVVVSELIGRKLGLKNSLITGAFALSFLSLPTIIIATRQALLSLPFDIKAGMFALGATKIQTVFKLTLPATYGTILTGIILVMARALGEAAPLIAIGAVTYSPIIPLHPLNETTALPIQIFTWVSKPQKEFIKLASATIIVLIAIILILTLTAMIIRYKWARKKVW